MRSLRAISAVLCATPLVAVALVSAPAQRPVANWALSGRVVDAATGRPIEGASVIARMDVQPIRGYSTSSAADGSYHFDQLRAGTYFVFVPIAHRTIDPSWRTNELDTGNGGGSPPPAILDAGGRYRLRLEPTSLMSVVASRTFTFETTFHPSASSFESARRVVIDSGRTHPGIDIGVRRVPGRRVTGMVVGPKFGGANGPGESVVLLSADDDRFKLGGATKAGGYATAMTLTQEGPFVFMSVPPGRYTIEAYQASHGVVVGKRDTRLVGALTVADSDVSGITITVPVR